MTSPRKLKGDLRSRCHGTPECLPVPDPAAETMLLHLGMRRRKPA